MITRLAVSSAFTITSPSSAQNLIARSSDASDTMNLSIVGATAGPVAATETRALTGKREVNFATNSLITLTGANLASSATGTITICSQGAAGTAQMIALTVPANATTITVGLTGFTQAYTFRSPCRETILLPATGASLVTGALPASYIKITLNGTAKYFWFSNGTTTDPAPGGTGYAVTFTGADADTVMAAALRASMVTNLTNFATTVSSATVTITGIALGSITISQNAASFTLTSVEAGTADAAYQIRTGYHTDGVAATTSNIADYIDRALDASGTAGQHYGTGTAANPYLTSGASGTSVNLSDRLAVSRLLAWSFAQSSTHFSLPSTMSGGVNGTVLATLYAGTTQAYSSFTLWSPDALTATLPALATPTTNSVQTRGRNFTIHARCENVVSAIAMRLETSDDGTNWASRTATYPIISADNNEQWVSVSEPVEFARIVFTANANTLTSALHTVIIST